MSLLEHVVTTSEKNSSEKDKHQDLFVELRERLYRRITSQRIAELMSNNKALAHREVGGLLDLICREEPFVRLATQEQDKLKEELMAMILGYGPIQELLEDDSITEIMVNGTRSVFYERDGMLYKSQVGFVDDEQIRILLDRILSPLGRRIDEQCPYVNARLPQGHRVNAIIPPLAVDGPAVTIRKFREEIYTLDELCSKGTLDERVAQLLTWAVESKRSVAVSGGTGSGKTTLLNALSIKIPHGERIITIEDSAELRFSAHPHVVRLEARPMNAEGTGEVTIRELLVNALRMRPDRIIVGECRSVETVDMLQAMITGHDGSMTTLHSSSPAEAISRLVMMARWGVDLPVDVLEEQIAMAFDLIVQLDRMPQGNRVVTQIAAVGGGKQGVELKPLVFWDRARECYEWFESPAWLDELALFNVATEQEVEQWRKACCL